MHPDDPRFTAFALGEPLAPADQTTLEAALEADPALRAEFDDLRAFAGGLRAAVRDPAAGPPSVSAPDRIPARRAPLPPRLLPFPEITEDARWRRQIVRLAAVLLLSAGAIAGAGWWTSQRETRAELPREELAVIELDLTTPEVPPGLTPAQQAESVRAVLRERWERVASGLQAGRLPVAAAIPAAASILGLLPAESDDAPDRVSVTTAALPGDPTRSWVRVSVPSALADAAGGGIRVETRRMDGVIVREMAGGVGPGGERVVLFEVTSRALAPLLQVRVAGQDSVAVEAGALRGDFRAASAGLRRAATLLALSDALRSEKSGARSALRDAASLAESAGEAASSLVSLARKAAELIEAEQPGA